ncbi:hypothetical protein P3T76_014811 [Phytophthora citrophthora]|uniref:Uncharacterized protein n=1 Tax=Phytophthora citrophthora TaxID=4793 RepID=A0AAD9G0I7_9STRA|nr:hypothetical protein P3T76_014811 [Phytophthora citrophthora]
MFVAVNSIHRSFAKVLGAAALVMWWTLRDASRVRPLHAVSIGDRPGRKQKIRSSRRPKMLAP